MTADPLPITQTPAWIRTVVRIHSDNLKAAIEVEDYERAARLRDRIEFWKASIRHSSEAQTSCGQF